MGASLKLEDCEILQIDETKYGYRKAMVKLSPEKVIVMKEFEEKVKLKGVWVNDEKKPFPQL